MLQDTVPGELARNLICKALFPEWTTTPTLLWSSLALEHPPEWLDSRTMPRWSAGTGLWWQVWETSLPRVLMDSQLTMYQLLLLPHLLLPQLHLHLLLRVYSRESLVELLIVIIRLSSKQSASAEAIQEIQSKEQNVVSRWLQWW